MQENNAAVGVVFNLLTKEGIEYCFQNFLRGEDFLFKEKSYQFLPITYYPPEKNSTRGSGQAEFKLPNLPEILEILVVNNYFKDAEIEAFIITEDFPNSPLLQQARVIVNSYGIEEDSKEGKIRLTCGKRTNALNGQIPNVFYTTGFAGASNIIGYIPEVPLTGQVSIG
jgi:hypothetical protein